jgi:hypothetical protein
MTGNDLIVLAPWVAFGAGLAFVCLWLRRSGRPSRRPLSPRGTRYRGRQPEPGDGPEPDPRRPGQAARHSQRGARE